MKTSKKFLCTLIAMMLIIIPLSSGFTAFAATGTYIIENAKGVNLYKAANNTSALLAVIRQNTIIEVTAVSGKFGKTTYDGYTGWITLSEIKPYAVKNENITKITITKKPDKLSYYEEETFDSTGLVLTAHYQDGSTAIVKQPVIYTESLNVEGTKTVTLMHEGHTAKFTITVKRLPIDRIEITTPPNTTNVKEGLQPDLRGMVLTVYYTDGREPHPAANYTIIGYNPNKIGAQTITLMYRYENITTSLDINVLPKVLERIQISTPPSKLDYYGDEREINLSGMILTAYYDNGTNQSVTADSAECKDMKLGENTVTVKYKDKTATYTITLHELVITGFHISEPKKTVYIKGEAADWDGLSIYYEYNSGAKKYITEGYTISKPNMNTIGVHTVEVRYNDDSAMFKITVHGTNLFCDINFNGKVETSEARKILRAAVSIEQLSFEQLLACDLGAGGKPTTSTARKALRLAVKIDEPKYLF